MKPDETAVGGDLSRLAVGRSWHGRTVCSVCDARAKFQYNLTLTSSGDRQSAEEDSDEYRGELLQRHHSDTGRRSPAVANANRDNILWELAYAPAIGHPASLGPRRGASSRSMVPGAVENFRFIDPRSTRLPTHSGVAQVKAKLDQAHRRILRQRIRCVLACRWR
jgi:hypothetical protein